MIISRAVMIALLLSSSSVFAEVQNKELVKACGEKTIVYGREDGKLVRAGESVDGFCSGYLQASLNSITSAGSCKAQGEDPALLSSVYMQFIKDNSVPDSDGAFSTTTKALRRIVQCK